MPETIERHVYPTPVIDFEDGFSGEISDSDDVETEYPNRIQVTVNVWEQKSNEVRVLHYENNQVIDRITFVLTDGEHRMCGLDDSSREVADLPEAITHAVYKSGFAIENHQPIDQTLIDITDCGNISSILEAKADHVQPLYENVLRTTADKLRSVQTTLIVRHVLGSDAYQKLFQTLFDQQFGEAPESDEEFGLVASRLYDYALSISQKYNANERLVQHPMFEPGVGERAFDMKVFHELSRNQAETDSIYANVFIPGGAARYDFRWTGNGTGIFERKRSVNRPSQGAIEILHKIRGIEITNVPMVAESQSGIEMILGTKKFLESLADQYSDEGIEAFNILVQNAINGCEETLAVSLLHEQTSEAELDVAYSQLDIQGEELSERLAAGQISSTELFKTLGDIIGTDKLLDIRDELENLGARLPSEPVKK